MSSQGMNKLLLLLLGLALLTAGFLFWQNQQTQQALVQMQQQMQRSAMSPEGKKGEDPYLAGPVKNSITKAAGELQACYLDLLKTKPEITAGKVHLDWQIDGEGKVFGAGIVQNQLGDKAFGDCVVQKISVIRFPQPPFGQPKYVEHSLFFKDQAALKADAEARQQGPLVQLPAQ
ncbi:MAG: AgmX/PglI C-terminal domain-containing protein [bacterium]|nr:AgmX/PglI C-terminal domain-containing protein [bacterium]